MAMATALSLETSSKECKQARQSARRLAPRLRQHKVCRLETEALGDCQFIAIARTAGLNMKHGELRQQICNYLELLPDIFGDFWEGHFADFTHYLAYMRSDGSWSDYLTLTAAANLLLRPI